MNIGKIANKLSHYLFWGLFTFVVFLLVIVFSFKLLPELNEDILKNGIGAFFGAFFAFMFIILARWTSDKKKNNRDHFDSLINIERLLGRAISRLRANISSFDEHIKKLRATKRYYWYPYSIPFNYEYSDALKNIDYINDYLNLCMDMEYVNGDLVEMRTSYQDCANLYADNKVDNGGFDSYLAGLIDEMNKGIKRMKLTEASAYRLVTKTRILLREQDSRSILFGAFPKKHYDKRINQLVEDEQRTLTKSIAENDAKRQEEEKSLESVISILSDLRRNGKAS